MVEMEKLSNQLKYLKTGMMTELKKEMDDRGFYSQEHSTNKIIDLITTVTANQTQAIFNRLKESTGFANNSAAEAATRTASEYSDFVMIEEKNMTDDLPKNATKDEVQLS